MKRPKAVVINETPDGKRNLRNLLKRDVKDDSGLTFDVISAEDVTNPGKLRRNSRLLKGNIYFIHEDPDNKKLAPEIAKVLTEKGAGGGKLLTTEGKTEQPYEVTRAEPGYKEFSGWLSKNSEQDFDAGEVTRKVQELRRMRKLSQPLSIGIIGLGTLGLGTLEEAARSDSITTAHVYTNFVNGIYNNLLAGLDLTGEQREKIITHGAELNGVLQADPDVLVITTGKHGTDYEVPNRTLLTETLFKTGLPKIDPILRAIIANKFQGLIALQSNPNGHFIKYATTLGIPRNQLTSFPPDTIRHRAELYEYLKQIDSDLREDDILLRAVGEHMKGGTPLYLEAHININDQPRPLFDAFPQLKDKALQREICQSARGRGLQVVQSANEHQHDYRGVPQRVRECLEDISCLQRDSRYPIYTGLLSVPTEFVYKNDPKNGNGMYVRVKRTCKTTELTKDREILKELARDARVVIEQTDEWTE